MSRPKGLRFRPPPVALSDELLWLLQAAFGPAWQPPPPQCAPAEIAELATAFDLGPRIVTRHGPERLRESLGTEAESLVHSHRRAVAAGLAHERIASEISALATRLTIPIVFLKGYALDRLLRPAPGWRHYTDLDLLVATPVAASLHDALLTAGFRSLQVPANEQHFAPLISPAGVPVDLHFCLRGVTLGKTWATAEELYASGHCQPLDGHDGLVAVPDRAVLAAHLIAHGIEQHGQRPESYPLLRLISDLTRLKAVSGFGRDLLGQITSWIKASVSAEEAAAAFRLAELLSAGRVPGGEGDAHARLLLSHIVAGTLDASYAKGLRFGHTAGRLRVALRQGHLLGYLTRKLSSARRLDRVLPTRGR